MPPKIEKEKSSSSGRPLPRRLFSIDALKNSLADVKTSTGQTSQDRDDSPSRSQPRSRGTSSPSVWLDADPFADSPRGAADGSEGLGRLTSSPASASTSEFDFLPKSATRTLSEDPEGKSSRFKMPRPPALGVPNRSFTASDTGSIPASPSRLRWEHLRQAVLPADGTAPIASTETAVPNRQQPPAPKITAPTKPSRLAARLGFRQATSETSRSPQQLQRVTSLASISHSLQFAEELRKACWSARFGSVPPPSLQKHKRDATDGGSLIGGYITRPFGGTSLGASSQNNSSMALPLFTVSKGTTRTQPVAAQRVMGPTSVRALHQVILNYASLADNSGMVDAPTTLPRETDVLSALMVPFLPPRNPQFPPGPEEQRLAIDAFEVACKVFRPINAEGEITRALWITRAAPLAFEATTRMSMVGILYLVLFPRGRECRIETPGGIRLLLGALYGLLANLNVVGEEEAARLLRDLIGLVETGQLGVLKKKEVEAEYGVRYAEDENDKVVFAEVARGSAIGALDGLQNAAMVWMLRNVIEGQLMSDRSLVQETPLIQRIVARDRTWLTRSLLRFVKPTTDVQTLEVILDIIPHFTRNSEASAEATEETQTMVGVARLLIELLADGRVADKTTESFHKTHQDMNVTKTRKPAFAYATKDFMLAAKWEKILLVMQLFTETIAENMRKEILGYALPALHERLISQKGEEDLNVPALKSWLTSVSTTYPALFFKPVFACAAAATPQVVFNHIRALHALSRFVPEIIWTGNAEMMSMAIGGDFGGVKKEGAVEEGRLGQIILLLEVVTRLKGMREDRKTRETGSVSEGTQSLRSIILFAVELETRLGILIETKERKAPIPVIQRSLFCSLFLQTRLLSRSLKSSTWLPRIISWTVGKLDEKKNDGFGYYGDVDVGQIDEMTAAISEVRSTLLLGSASTAIDSPFSDPSSSPVDLDLISRMKVLDVIGKGLIATAFELLISVSALIGTEDLRRIGKTVWEDLLQGSDDDFVSKACFLVVQFADKSPQGFTEMLQQDITSPDPSVRKDATLKLSVILGRRFQLLSHTTITDRTHPRPFRSVRPQVNFVPTDIGSSRYVPKEVDESADGSSGAFKQELQKTLRDIGWDSEGPGMDVAAVWRATPLSFLPIRQLRRPDVVQDIADRPSTPTGSPVSSPLASPGASPSHDALLRRNSSESLVTGRRRAIYVPAVTNGFALMASLVYDPDYSVAAHARQLIFDLLKEDPSAAARFVNDHLDGTANDVATAVSTLRAYIHTSHTLPPGMAFHVFNHLAGALRQWRQVLHPDGLSMYAQTAPLLAKTMTQVSDASIRELRRAKIEMFLIPTGAFWFAPTTQESPMFPRSLVETLREDGVEPSIVQMTTVRISQNLFLLEMLKRSPQDIQTVRKTLSRLVLPSKNGVTYTSPPSLADFIPHFSTMQPNASPTDASLRSLSLALSRSYVLLVTQIFRVLTRHLADREELAVYMDSLNQILLVHGDDGGIVTQVMIAYMVASTRFRRLFTSQGYIMFFAAVFKAYVESLSTRDLIATGGSDTPAPNMVRDAIEHAIARFYVLHSESFTFQILVVLSRLMHLPNFPAEWASKRVFKMLTALERGPPAADSSGVRGINRQEEHEAIIARIAEETPQVLLTSVRRNMGQKNGKNGHSPSDDMTSSVNEYEIKRLGLDNIVRLILTVIAHNPTVLRAEYFMRLLSFLTPHLCGSSASTVLRDGIDALGIIVLTRIAGKAKVTGDGQLQGLSGTSYEVFSQENEEKQNETKAPADFSVMRMDYLHLVLAFVSNGGHLSQQSVNRVIELVRLVGGVGSEERRDKLSSFVAKWVKATLIRDPLPEMRMMIGFLSSIATLFPSRDVGSASGVSIDFSGVFDVLSELSTNPVLASNSRFEKAMVNDFCSMGISLWLASSSKSYAARLRDAILSLVYETIGFSQTDVVGEIEKFASTGYFLSEFILPLVSGLKTRQEIASIQNLVDGRRYSRAWGRLLGYVMAALDRDDSSPPDMIRRLSQNSPRRSTSQDKTHSISVATKEAALKLLTIVQIVKIVVTRADEELSEMLPGLWPRLGQFLLSILKKGSARFALQQTDQLDSELSAPPSPMPGVTPSTPQTGNTDFSFLSAYSPRPSTSSVSIRAWPRLEDYLLWSFLELICRRKTPLMIQLRLLIREKTLTLHQELHLQSQQEIQTMSRRGTMAERPMSLSGTLFAKGRRRTSSYIPSPIASVQAGSQSLFPSSPLARTNEMGEIRVPGYNRDSLASPDTIARAEQRGGPKIIHLGPVEGHLHPNRPSLDGDASAEAFVAQTHDRHIQAAKALEIRSDALMRRTCMSIRTVQTFMNYELLVQVPRDETADNNSTTINTKIWDHRQVIEQVLLETKIALEFLRSVTVE